MLSAAVSSDFPTSPFLAKFRIVDQPQGRFIPTKDGIGDQVTRPDHLDS